MMVQVNEKLKRLEQLEMELDRGIKLNARDKTDFMF